MSRKRAACRFCLETDFYKNLISPCDCKGSCKYVHHKCLAQWYNQRPDRGLQCGICNQDLSRETVQPLEDIVFIDTIFENYKLNEPMYMCLFLHGVYVSIYGMLYNSTSGNHVLLYGMYQGICHIWYSRGLYLAIQNVKNKQQYWQYWISWNTVALIVTHLGCLLTFLYSPYGSGIASNVCFTLYFLTHYENLQELNKHSTFMFVSKQTRRLR